MNKKLIYIGSMLLMLSTQTMAQDAVGLENDSVKQSMLTPEVRRTQAVSTVNADELTKNGTRNPLNTLYGLLPGLSVMQQTGWMDNPTLIVRGRGSLNGAGPLVIVDGFPRPIEYLNTEEIESVSVLKDGAATALWGTRGANGVIVVTTKRGVEGKMSVGVNYRFGMDYPINQPKFADGYTYALMRNEALRNDGLPEQYADPEMFRNPNADRDLYSNTDWLGEALRKHTYNHQADITFRGGSKRLRYYTMLSYKNDMGILDTKYTDYSERYNSQMKKYNLNLRMNLDVELTSTTTAKLSMLGMLYERKRPNTAEGDLFGDLFRVPSAAFPAKTSHNVWGSNNVYKMNPIAQIADVGYYKEDQRMLQADLRILQDLSIVLPGLKAEGAISYDNSATYRETGKKDYIYEVNTLLLNPVSGQFEKDSKLFGQDEALAITNTGLADQYLRSNLEFKLAYERAFGLHNVSASALYRQESLVPTGQAKSRYRQYLNFVAGYNFDNRYLLDVVVNHTGTSVLPKGDRFRTYPAISAGWILSNEAFMENVTPISNLKLRASFGRSGYDGFDNYMDRQYWNGGNTGQFYFNNTTAEYGMREGILPLTNMSCEVSDKYNVGLDMQLFGKLTFSADWFMDKRRNILIDGNKMFSSALGVDVPKIFAGAVDTKGGEVALNWQDGNQNFKYNIGVNFSYAASKVIENGEGPLPFSYLSAKGLPLGQIFGLEAIGYFSDEMDIANSPTQVFSEVRPGDIKYKDQNGDKKIDKNDQVAIGGSSSIPKSYYGINLGFEYKGFGVDALFQGASGFSKMLNTASVYWPMRNNTNISSWYIEDNVRWTEATKDIATVPRLTTQNAANNFQNSTQWLVDGSFFKLRNLNVYYNLPKPWVRQARIENVRIFAQANNLFSIDNVKYLNCEDLGVNYPDMLSVSMGFNINF